jgi:hypothetical protein
MDAFGDEAMILVPAISLIFAAVILSSLLVSAPNLDEGLLPRHRFDADVDDAFSVPSRGFRMPDRYRGLPGRVAAREATAMELATLKGPSSTPEDGAAAAPAAAAAAGGGGGRGGAAAALKDDVWS